MNIEIFQWSSDQVTTDDVEQAQARGILQSAEADLWQLRVLHVEAWEAHEQARAVLEQALAVLDRARVGPAVLFDQACVALGKALADLWRARVTPEQAQVKFEQARDAYSRARWPTFEGRSPPTVSRAI